MIVSTHCGQSLVGANEDEVRELFRAHCRACEPCRADAIADLTMRAGLLVDVGLTLAVNGAHSGRGFSLSLLLVVVGVALWLRARVSP